MNEFVGTVPFLRMALGFDMKTMHFHIAQTGLILGQFGTHLKIVLWCKVGRISSQTNTNLWKYNTIRLV